MIPILVVLSEVCLCFFGVLFLLLNSYFSKNKKGERSESSQYRKSGRSDSGSSARAVPKAASSQPAAVSSDTAVPATPPAKGMFISNARAVPTFPIPSVPKQQMPRKDGGSGGGDQSNTGEAHQMSKAKRDVQILSAPPVTQTQKASVHPIPGVSMPMPFHQPQVPVQFGGPNPQIQSQGMTASSLPMSFPPQLQQQVFVPSMQPHPMQPQGMMHQGPSLNFTAQMGPQVPQIGNLGIGMSPQFAQQQAGKFGTPRRPFKITHPDIHEELRLGRRADTHMDGGSSGPRTHPNVPQSQPITSVPPLHSINYYSSSYNPNSLYFPGPTSVPLTSNQINPSSPQPPRFSYAVSQSPQTVSFMNPSAQNSYTNKKSTLMHGIAEPSSLEHSRDVHNAISSASLATEDINAGLVSLQAAGSKDKPVLLELKRRAKGKKERKEILQKAHAAGTTSDLYMAYKGPEGKKETDASSESLASTSSISSKQVLVDVKDDVVLSENGGRSKAEPDDWEDAADISTPKLDTTVVDGKLSHGELKHVGEDGNGVMAKKYSRDVVDDNLVISTSLVPDATNDKTSSSSPSLTTCSYVDDKTSISDDSFSRSDSLGSSEAAVTKSVLSDKGVAPVSTTPSVLEPTLKNEGEGTEDINAGLVSLQAAGSKDKPVLELSRSKSTVAKGKKKRKEILQKADAARTTSDLCMAYKGPEGKKETDASSESLACTSSISSKQVLVDVMDDVILSENGGQSKPEPDDWEDAADISTPKLDTTVVDGKLSHGELKHVGEDGNGVMAKKYSRDFILKFREQCTSLQEGFEYKSDIVEALTVSNVNASHESFPSPGRIIDRPSAGLVSLPAAGSKDKPVLELSRSNSTVAKEKKKRKKNLQKKRNSAGTTSDLDPEGKKETVASSSESLASTSSINSKQVLVDVKDDVVLSENGGQSKVLEPDDWEDATDISTPKLDTTVDDGKLAHGGLKHVGEDGNGVMAKKYSRDFLLKFREQCTSLH